MWALWVSNGLIEGKNIPPQRFASLAAPPNKGAKQTASPEFDITSNFSAARPPEVWLCYYLVKGKFIFSPKRGFP